MGSLETELKVSFRYSGRYSTRSRLSSRVLKNQYLDCCIQFKTFLPVVFAPFLAVPGWIKRPIWLLEQAFGGHLEILLPFWA